MESSFPAPVRVYLLDNAPIFREAVQRFLADEPDIQVVGAAPASVNTYEALAGLQPDLILLDPGAHGAHGDGLASRIAHLRQHCAGASVVILALEFDGDTGTQALAAGADGFISKERTAEDLRNAILVAAVNRAHGSG